MSSSSLAGRLVVHLLGGLLLIYVLTILWLQFGFTVSSASELQWDDFSQLGTHILVADSVVRSQDGSIRIDPTAGLRAEIERTPTLRYAAFDPDTGLAALGSSAELAAALGHENGIEALTAIFRLRDGKDQKQKFFLGLRDTPAGKLAIAISGYRFNWPMLLRNVIDAYADTFRYFAPTFAVAMGIGWFSLRRGLKPLRDAADQANQIDMNAIDRRLSPAGMPSEILPLISTVNDALDRLGAGVERHRRFIANAAHELRTPITVLNARLDAPRKPSFENDLKGDVRRIRTVVDQLLVAARLGKQGSDLDDDVDLLETIQAIVDDHALLAIKRKQQIHFEAENAPIVVRGDRSALESVVANLVDNALRAEPEGGIVSVRLHRGAMIEVVDHGEGVAEGDRELIFEPFWRRVQRRRAPALASPSSGRSWNCIAEKFASRKRPAAAPRSR